MVRQLLLTLLPLSLAACGCSGHSEYAWIGHRADGSLMSQSEVSHIMHKHRPALAAMQKDARAQTDALRASECAKPKPFAEIVLDRSRANLSQNDLWIRDRINNSNLYQALCAPDFSYEAYEPAVTLVCKHCYAASGNDLHFTSFEAAERYHADGLTFGERPIRSMNACVRIM